MIDVITLLFYVMLGAVLMFLLDPDRGKSRRSYMKDKIVRYVRKAGRIIDQRTHDLDNRVHGMLTERRLRRKADQPEDEILAERVRAKMGHKIAHPHEIEVASFRGIITLAGRAPELEILPALAAARQVRGVVRVKDRIRALPQESTLQPVPNPMGSRVGRW